MKYNAVLCDTSFFIRLLDKNDPLHSNAKGYFRFFLENDYRLLISTIAIAEYCIVGALDELPLKNLQIVPFNLDHSIRTAELARYVFKNKGKLKLRERNIIPNDTKLFAQADNIKGTSFYISSDTESFKIYSLLRKELQLKFQFIDLNTPHSETFGMLNFS